MHIMAKHCPNVLRKFLFPLIILFLCDICFGCFKFIPCKEDILEVVRQVVAMLINHSVDNTLAVLGISPSESLRIIV
jgi:hypothetical protein